MNSICSRCEDQLGPQPNWYTSGSYDKGWELKVLCLKCKQAVMSGRPWELDKSTKFPF